MVLRATGLLCLALAISACTTAETDRAPGAGVAAAPSDGGSGGARSDADDDACADIPAARGPAETCCPSHGIDACGAGFFCAKVGGRTVATCAPNGSLAGGEPCDFDAACASQSCNRAAGACRGVLGGACVDAVGCAGQAACYRAVCKPTAGGPRAHCDDDSDCKPSSRCLAGRCGDADGTRCSESATCATRHCARPEGLNYGKCAPCTTDVECQTELASTFEVCRGGLCVHTCKTDQHCQYMTSINACAVLGCEPYTCSAAGECE